MSTLKQIESNRRNAQKSTGPRTPQGKARSSVNGIQHGLSAQLLVIPTESQPEYDAHAAAMRADLEPSGAVEEVLTDHLIAASWRLRRLRAFETRYYHDSADLMRPLNPKANLELDIAMNIFCNSNGPMQRDLNNLARHESRLERSFYKALKELQNVQDRRREKEALQSEPDSEQPPPLVIDPDVARASRPAEPRVVSAFPPPPPPPDPISDAPPTQES